MILAQTPPKHGLVPPGPIEPFGSAEDLFHWISQNFEHYGDIYRASVCGSNVYVVSAPEYCEHILRRIIVS